MAEPAVISVRRQVVEVDLRGAQSDGLALQRRLAGVCADAVSPAIESAFSSVVLGDEYLFIDRLHITIADIRLDRLEEDLAEAVHREVALYLRSNPPALAAADGDSGDLQESLPHVLRLSRAETVDDALVVFLRTGRLPWSFSVPADSSLERVVLDVWGASGAGRGPTPTTRARLADALRAPNARRRLLIQFTPGFVTRVLSALSSSGEAAMEEVLTAVRAIDPSAPSSSWSSSTPPAAAFAREIQAAALLAVVTDRRPHAGELVRWAWLRSKLPERERRELAAVLERQWPGATEPGAASTQPQPNPVSSPVTPPRTAVVDEGAEGIVVDNAGAVLLHPFLARYFSGLGVAVGDGLVDPHRAVCLLHHLATGELEAPEHRLPLAKLLCGVALDEPVEADVGLTGAEVEESAALLDAAIRHWGALRGSSPDALRREFLMRAGTLSTDADGDWLLRVASETADILLDQLPWGISLLKLPWMSRPLRVEWR